MPRALLPLVALTTSLLAQGNASTFVPKPHLVRFVAEDVGKLLEQLPQTAIGKLLADPEVATAFGAGLQRYRELGARRQALFAAIAAHKVEVDPWLLANLPFAEGWDAVREVDLADMLRVELGAVHTADPQVDPSPTSYALLTCRPRAEGRWTAIFERRAKAMADGRYWRAQPDARFAGFPAYSFVLAPKDELAGANAPVQEQPPLEHASVWLLHLPGLFAFGGNAPEACGTFAPPPARQSPHVVGEMDLEAYVAMFGSTMGGVPAEFAALGFDGLKVLRWRGQFAGSRILDEFEAELADEPKGLVGALLAGKAALPPQPLPDGALVQLRAAIDVPLLLSAVAQAGGDDVIPEALGQRIAKAFSGGVALGVTAPAPGGLIPRLYLSLAIADDKALDELLAALVHDPMPKKQVTYENVPCTVLTLPDLPQGLQPTWCRIDGVLHVAESGLSMRAFLKARGKGGDAMDVGDAPVPDGAGDLLPTFDLRADERALYRTFHKVWLPLLKLIPNGGELNPLLTEQEMPAPEAVEPHLGRIRGVLRRQGNTWRLQQLGALGGIEAAAIAMTWGPFLSGLFHRDYVEEALATALARHQLTAAWTALEAFHKANQRWPNDLTELFVAQKLPADALLLAGDAKAEAVPMPAGDARVVKSSYRYFKNPVKVDVQGNAQRMLLICIAPRRYNRPMLGDDGAIPDVWGEDCTRPVDQFGK